MCPGLQIVPAAGHFPDKIRGCSGFLDFDRQYELLGPFGLAKIERLSIRRQSCDYFDEFALCNGKLESERL